MKNYSDEIAARASKIKMLILDVDGVLTDGKLIYGTYGDEIKNFNVNDGLGMFLVKKARLKCVILTAKASRVVRKRAKELKVDGVYDNFHYKLEAFNKIVKKFRLAPEEICFVGDDLIDIPVLKRSGLSACPPNAVDEVKEVVHFVTEKSGGQGAVREVCDLLLRSQGLWEKVTAKYYE